jgi:hypothetical protein
MPFYVAGFVISVLSGLFTSSWGAFKDAPYERFNRRSFVRSLVFSAGVFVALCASEPVRAHVVQLPLVLVFFLVMGLERLAIEIYKPCFRREDQSKYLIPQDFSFGGMHVARSGSRCAIGVVLTGIAIGIVMLGPTIASYPQHLLVAAATGLAICIGGAGKDAPFEGFQPRKFLRSAIVLVLASPVIYALGPAPLGLLVFIYGGLERLLVESYKTYFTPTMPGKFLRGSPVIDHAFLRYRPMLRLNALAIVTLVCGLYVSALAPRLFQ